MYAVELVCYDLRRLFPHLLTCEISDDPRPVQDGIDKQIVIHYAPGRPRDKGLLLRIIRGEVPPLPPGYLKHLERCVAGERVKFPDRLKECIQARWRALGYKGISNYVTGLIRYDLALCGPHNECNGSIRDKGMLADLDELTAKKFAEGKIERIRLIDFLEEALGRPLTIEESFDEIRKLVKRLRKAAGFGS
jgi:hypothetical protein